MKRHLWLMVLLVFLVVGGISVSLFHFLFSHNSVNGISYSTAIEVSGFKFGLKSSQDLDGYLQEIGFYPSVKDEGVTVRGVKQVQIVLTAEVQKSYRVVNNGQIQQSFGFTYDAQNQKLSLKIYYQPLVLTEMSADIYGQARLNRDLLNYFCDFSTPSLTEAKSTTCAQMTNAYLSKINNRLIFTLTNNLRLTLLKVKPVMAASISCPRGYSTTDFYCGSYQYTNCICSVAGHTCGNNSNYSSCGLGTCSCSSQSCIALENNQAHDCLDTSCNAACGGYGGDCVTSGSCPAPQACGVCSNYGSCKADSGYCMKQGTPSCYGESTGDCYIQCSASDAGCTEEDCPTNQGYGGGKKRAGGFSSGCTCATKDCPAICTAVNGTWGTWSDTCSAQCGQSRSRTCGGGCACGGTCTDSTATGACGGTDTGTCASTDATTPGQVPISSPNGASSGSPTIVSTTVTLMWSDSETNHNYTDSYQYRVYNATNSTWVVGDNNGGITVSGGATAKTVSFTGTTSKIYYWQVRAVNSTCGSYTAGTTYGAWSTAGYFKIDSIPQIVSLAILNSAGAAVTVETGSKNQICQTNFLNSTSPRKVTFQLTMSDADGCADINSATLKWNGNVYNLALNGCVGTTTVDYTGVNDSGTYAINGSVSDKEGLTSGLVSTGRSWKVWDCQIPVSGTLYDGSSGQACNSTGFTTAVDNALGFSSLIYHDESSGGDVTLATSLPAAYGPTSVIWGKTYLPLFNGGSATTNINGDLAGTGRMTRLINLDTGVTTCPMTTDIGLSGYFSAYDTNHNAQIDFSFIRDQENWFQVSGGGVKAKNEIVSGVPVTMDSSSRALSIFGVNADNGLISFTSFSNINGNNNDNDYGTPNNWWVDRNTNDSTVYNYQGFYNDFYVKKGIGVTGTDWAGKPNDGVYFVDGDLLIDSDFSLASGKSMMVIVKGKISIDSSVNRLDGIYVADGGINALGTSPEQLVINGSLYSRGKIRLARSYIDKSMNDTSPAVKVNYDPALIFNLPGIVMREMSGWNEE